ncbi:MAG: N-acetyltransferase family protein [Alphaproteobacteria bacterium]|nr:N-acetyltransferase family protein [Alphaproteobacteria bacterium]
MTAAPVVRPSRATDVAGIAAIYGHHVINGLASFEEIAPDAEEIARRRADVLATGYPYLVAELEGRVAGYAYCTQYRLRSGYRFSVENSIYVAPDSQRAGIGSALLRSLIDAATFRGARQMIAVIGDSANHASIGLHRRFGFRMVGTIEAVGFKLGRWVDSVLMQRALGEGSATFPSSGR